jgi:hypothetical protein
MLAIGLLVIGVSEAEAESVTIELGQGVRSHADAVVGDAAVLQFNLPAVLAGKRIDTAVLEFYVDAGLKAEVADGEVPVVDIAALTGAYDSAKPLALDAAPAASRHVRVGENRRVAVDITSLVKAWQTGTKENHGIALGALTGTRSGTFALRDGTLGSGVKARITIFYQNRFGNRVSSQ